MAMKIFTHEEVALHNKESDIWLIIHGGVYDLTKFLKEHPGGEEVLIKLAGTDGTVCFDDMGHTREAVQLRETFKIGEISADSVPVNNTENNASSNDIPDDWTYQEHKEEKSLLLPIIIGIGAVIYVYIFFYLN